MSTTHSHRQAAAVSYLLSALVLTGCRNDDVTAVSQWRAQRALADVAGGSSTAAKKCQKDGWRQLARSDLTAFGSEGDCVSYVAMGGKFGQTISFVTSSPSPVHIGDASYRPRATASSGLPVALSLDAASTGCTLASGVVSFTAAGTCIIDANQAGDELWATAAQVQQSIAVLQRTQTISFTSTNPSPLHVGAADYMPTAVASSGLTVTISLDATSIGCSLSGGLVSFTGPGLCRVNANQAGNATWLPAAQVQQSINITVNPAAYCASIGGTYDEPSSGYLWTCNDWTAASESDLDTKADILTDACRVDNGLITGPADYNWTNPFPSEVDYRCHLPN